MPCLIKVSIGKSWMKWIRETPFRSVRACFWFFFSSVFDHELHLKLSCCRKPPKAPHHLGIFLSYLPALWITLLRLYLFLLCHSRGALSRCCQKCIRCSLHHVTDANNDEECRCPLTVVESATWPCSSRTQAQLGVISERLANWQVEWAISQASSAFSEIGWGLETTLPRQFPRFVNCHLAQAKEKQRVLVSHWLFISDEIFLLSVPNHFI